MSKRKWQSLIFGINNGENKRTPVIGTAHKGLALVRIETGLWKIFHMNSGRGIMSASGNFQDVKRYTEAIAALTDWEALKTQEDVLAVPNIVARIRGVYNAYADDGITAEGHC